ncbi:MAG: hypothetical protein B7X52_05390, partial [Thiotrichales bacterium 34-46-19]
MTPAELGAQFKVENCGSAPARFDEAQLHYWQKEAVMRMDDASWWEWIGAETRALVPSTQQAAFIEAIRPNTVFPQDALTWAKILFTPLAFDSETEAAIAAAGPAFLTAVETHVKASYAEMIDSVKTASGAKGKALFLPLRLLMTARHDGPEMAKLWQLIGSEAMLARLGHSGSSSAVKPCWRV